MPQKDKCETCAHWDSRPELDMASKMGYCDYHEKSYRADYWCKYFLHRSSDEAAEYKRGIYGGGEEEEEGDDMDA